MFALGATVTNAASASACPAPDRAGAVHVTPAGDDSADGTAERPFRTLERARDAMATGPARVALLAGGRYELQRTLELDGADSLSSFLGCPGQAPILDGTAARLRTVIRAVGTVGVTFRNLVFSGGAEGLSLRSVSGARVIGNRFWNNGSAIVLAATSNSVVCGNRIRDSAASGIEAKDGSNDNLLAYNLIDGVDAPATHGGGIFLHGGSGNAIVGNRVQHTRGAGINVANWDGGTVNLGTVIAGNLVRDTNRDSSDSGAIYVLGRSHADTQTLILHNRIEGTGRGGDEHTIGIYLDDSASGVVVRFNVVRDVGTHAVQIHGGDDVLIEQNMLELRPEATSAVLFQAAPADTNPRNTMLNNRVARNAVVLYGAARPAFTFIDGGAPEIAGNLYLTAAPWPEDLPLGDSAPQFGRVSLEASSPSPAGLPAPFAFQALDPEAAGPEAAAVCQAGG